MIRLALALACLSVVPAHAANAANATAPAPADAAAIRPIVDRAVRPVMARYGVPGMAIALTVDGKAMFFNYGLASTATAKPVTEHTLFDLGSVSKTFTATLATHAQASGKLSLGDHPGRYIAALKGSPLDRATLLELGTYTAAGLPLQVPDEVQDDRQLLAWLAQWRPDAAPGTQRRYSNPSIGLLGRITALALESDFGDALERRIFPAFGLRHSYVRVPDSAMPDYAWGYDADDKPVRVGPGILDAESYGVKSSSADLVRFVQANIEPGRLDPTLRRAVQDTQVGHYQVGVMVQGLGWEQYRAPLRLERILEGNAPAMIQEAKPATRLAAAPPPAGTLFNKTGSTRGFGSYVAFIPDRKIGIVMLANKNLPIPARVEAAYAILDGIASITRQDAARR